MDVHGAPLVPARIDRSEGREPLRIRALDAAEEAIALGSLLGGARVHAARVAVPDLHRGALDRLAGRRVDHREPERERDAGLALGHVASEACAGHVVRPLGLLGREHAGHEARGDRSRSRPRGVGVRRIEELSSTPGAATHRHRRETSELAERTATAERVLLQA